MADILTDPQNKYNLYAPLVGVKRVDIAPTLNSSDEVVANAGLTFSGAGQPYITVAGSELRLGANSAGAGCKFLLSSNGTVCNITLNGVVNASNAVKSHGAGAWTASSSSATQTFAAVGLLAGDHVHITTVTPPSGATEFSHVVAGTDEFVVHLSGTEAGNEDFVFNWMALPQSA